MPRYFAIDAGVHFDASLSDLLRVDWQINSLSADFALPGQEEKCLRVNFDNQTIRADGNSGTRERRDHVVFPGSM